MSGQHWLKAVIARARREFQPRIAAKRTDKAIIRADPVVRVQLGRTAAHDLRDFGVRADDGDSAMTILGKRQNAVAIFQQHRSFGTRAADKGAVLGPVFCMFFMCSVVVQSAGPLH